MLRLASIQVPSRTVVDFWSSVVSIAVEYEKADGFVLDTTTRPNRTKVEAGEDRRLLSLIGGFPEDQQSSLQPIGGALDVLGSLADRILCVNLYVSDLWVAGVSDWGDDIDILFDEPAWLALDGVIDRLGVSLTRIDVAEAESRPRLRATR
jgi:hypothetical protein